MDAGRNDFLINAPESRILRVQAQDHPRTLRQPISSANLPGGTPLPGCFLSMLVMGLQGLTGNPSFLLSWKWQSKSRLSPDFLYWNNDSSGWRNSVNNIPSGTTLGTEGRLRSHPGRLAPLCRRSCGWSLFLRSHPAQILSPAATCLSKQAHMHTSPCPIHSNLLHF